MNYASKDYMMKHLPSQRNDLEFLLVVAMP